MLPLRVPGWNVSVRSLLGKPPTAPPSPGRGPDTLPARLLQQGYTLDTLRVAGGERLTYLAPERSGGASSGVTVALLLPRQTPENLQEEAETRALLAELQRVEAALEGAKTSRQNALQQLQTAQATAAAAVAQAQAQAQERVVQESKAAQERLEAALAAPPPGGWTGALGSEIGDELALEELTATLGAIANARLLAKRLARESGSF